MRSIRLAIWLLILYLAWSFPPAHEPVEKASSAAQPASDDTAAWMLKRARGRLSGKLSALTYEQASAPRQATEPRPATVFVTVFKRGYDLRPAAGSGESLADALKSALDAAAASIASAHAEGAARDPRPDRIQIDILDQAPSPLAKPYDRSELAAAHLMDLGAEGLAVEASGRVLHLLPAEFIYRSLIDGDGRQQSAADLLNRAMAHLGLEPSYWRSPQVKLSRFRTASFVEDHSLAAPLRVVRATVPVKQADSARLISSARAAGDYMVRMQRQDGSFWYWYYALEDRPNARAYNMLRHAGTAIALFDLYAATRDLRYLEAARRAVKFLKTRMRPARDGGGFYVLDNDGKAKLGANGLALIALVRQMELDRKSADMESAKRLANLILAMQAKSGAFDSYYRLRGDEPAGSVSLYYPGEAILGLVSLHRVSGDKSLLEAARRGADYLIESQRRMKALPPDAWLMQALEALYGLGRERKYAEHAIAHAEAMMATQYGDGDREGYAGGFGPGPPRSTPAAARAEGLLAAYRIARSISDARALKIGEAIRSAVRFQLSQQFNSDNTYFLPNPQRADGGFRASHSALQVRIDFVQHSISALLGAASSLR